jgi:ankyrin repeat protein
MFSSALGPHLLQAAASGDTASLRSLILQKADPNFCEPDTRQTPLMAAARHGHVAVVEILLAAGARTDATDHEAMTPLKFAAREGRLDVMERLIAAGAKVDAKSPGGATALMFAAAKGQLAAVKLLVAQGAQIDARMRARGKRHPSRTAATWAQERGHHDVVKFLLG